MFGISEHGRLLSASRGQTSSQVIHDRKKATPRMPPRLERESSVINQLNKQARLIAASRFHPLMEPVEQRI
jgi:hypothetical protein